MASAVAQSCALTPWARIGAPINGRSSIRDFSRSKASTSARAPRSLRVRAATQKQKRENVETPNISTPPLPVETSPPGETSNEVDATVESEQQQQEQLSAEDIGQQLKALRGKQASTVNQNFWGGVWEETKLVEWPQFQKVLGTTGVVVGIIFGSAILLLTVNAILAELSDQVFNGSSDFAKSWIRGSF